MARKRKFRPKSFETMISGGEPSASIYASMLKSPAWKKLKPRAQILYLYMKMQYYGVNIKLLRLHFVSDMDKGLKLLKQKKASTE